MIREASLTDVPRLLEMAEHFISSDLYRAVIAFEREPLTRLLMRLITEPEGMLWVDVVAMQVVGAIGVLIFDHPMSGERAVTELFWWVEPDHRGHGIRLWRQAEQWARDQAAQQMLMIAPTDAVGTLYERQGYQRVETSYMRRLS